MSFDDRTEDGFPREQASDFFMFVKEGNSQITVCDELNEVGKVFGPLL